MFEKAVASTILASFDGRNPRSRNSCRDFWREKRREEREEERNARENERKIESLEMGRWV